MRITQPARYVPAPIIQPGISAINSRRCDSFENKSKSTETVSFTGFKLSEYIADFLENREFSGINKRLKKEDIRGVESLVQSKRINDSTKVLLIARAMKESKNKDFQLTLVKAYESINPFYNFEATLKLQEILFHSIEDQDLNDEAKVEAFKLFIDKDGLKDLVTRKIYHQLNSLTHQMHNPAAFLMAMGKLEGHIDFKNKAYPIDTLVDKMSALQKSIQSDNLQVQLDRANQLQVDAALGYISDIDPISLDKESKPRDRIEDKTNYERLKTATQIVIRHAQSEKDLMSLKSKISEFISILSKKDLPEPQGLLKYLALIELTFNSSLKT